MTTFVQLLSLVSLVFLGVCFYFYVREIVQKPTFRIVGTALITCFIVFCILCFAMGYTTTDNTKPNEVEHISYVKEDIVEYVIPKSNLDTELPSARNLTYDDILAQDSQKSNYYQSQEYVDHINSLPRDEKKALIAKHLVAEINLELPDMSKKFGIKIEPVSFVAHYIGFLKENEIFSYSQVEFNTGLVAVFEIENIKDYTYITPHSISYIPGYKHNKMFSEYWIGMGEEK